MKIFLAGRSSEETAQLCVPDQHNCGTSTGNVILGINSKYVFQCQQSTSDRRTSFCFFFQIVKNTLHTYILHAEASG